MNIKKHVYLIILVLIIAFAIRLYDNKPLSSYYKDDNGDDYLYGYDAYFFYDKALYKPTDYYSKLIKDIHELFGISLYKSMIYLNAVFLIIIIILVYYLVFKFTHNKSMAFMSSLFLSISPRFYQRSFIGWADNDLINMVFYMILILLFFKITEGVMKQNWHKFFLYLVLSLIVSNTFSTFWSGHFFIYVIIFSYIIFRNFIRNFSFKTIIAPAIIIIILLITNSYGVSTVLNFESTVSENSGFQNLLIYFFNVDGYATFIFILLIGHFTSRKNFRKLNYDRYMFFSVWFMIITCVSIIYFKALYHLMIPYSILKGVLVVKLAHKNILKYSIYLSLIVLTMISPGYIKGEPIMNDDIKADADFIRGYEFDNCYMGNWWDYGIFYKAYSYHEHMPRSNEETAGFMLDYFNSNNEQAAISILKRHNICIFILSEDDFNKIYEEKKDSIIYRLWFNKNLTMHKLLKRTNSSVIYAIQDFHNLDNRQFLSENSIHLFPKYNQNNQYLHTNHKALT